MDYPFVRHHNAVISSPMTRLWQTCIANAAWTPPDRLRRLFLYDNSAC